MTLSVKLGRTPTITKILRIPHKCVEGDTLFFTVNGTRVSVSIPPTIKANRLKITSYSRQNFLVTYMEDNNY